VQCCRLHQTKLPASVHVHFSIKSHYVTFCMCMFSNSATVLMNVHLCLFGVGTSVACNAILLSLVHFLMYI
jgi:hypothetical protein